MTIVEALDRRAHAAANAAALDELDYGGLAAASRRVAAKLRAAGLRTWDRLAIYAENRPGFAFAYLGALRAGAVVVPTNVLYRASDLERVLGDSGATFVCVSKDSGAHVAPRPHVRLVRLEDVEAWAADATIDVRTEDVPPGPDDIAILIYTSGTTGRAKGAMLTHANLLAIGRQVVEAWHWSAADTLLLTLPLFHVHGLCAGLNGSLVAGGRILVRERFEAVPVLEALGRGEATMFFGVPTMYVRLLEHARATDDVAAVRLFVSGSAALPASVHEAFEQRFGATILERYGASEFGFALTNRYDGPRYAGTVGFPFPRVRVRLLGPDGGDVEADDAGEILVNGPNVFSGYWHDEAATSAAFLVDDRGERWFRSGDLARFDPQRGYTIAGRLKDLIISGGFNIYPIEIEDELLRIDGIRASAVVGRTDAARGEIPVAFVEADDPFDADAVIARLRERLASFKVPKALYRIGELPRNAMGKVEKRRLPQM